MTEQGELTRQTCTYRHNFGPYIRGRVASETVTVNGESTVGPATGAYVYNGDNQRKRRETAAGVTYTLHGAGGELLSEYDKPAGAPVWQRDFVYLGSRLLMSIGQSTASPPTVVTAYYHTDLLGSVRAVTDTTGNLTTAARRDYDAFGVEFGQPQHPQAPLSGERQRFAGDSAVDGSGLAYAGGEVFGGAVGGGLAGGGGAAFAAIRGGKYGSLFGRVVNGRPAVFNGGLNRNLRFGWGWNNSIGRDIIRLGLGPARGQSWSSHITFWIVK